MVVDKNTDFEDDVHFKISVSKGSADLFYYCVIVN